MCAKRRFQAWFYCDLQAQLDWDPQVRFYWDLEARFYWDLEAGPGEGWSWTRGRMEPLALQASAEASGVDGGTDV